MTTKEKDGFNIVPDETRPLAREDIARENMILALPGDSFGGKQVLSKGIISSVAEVTPTASVFRGTDRGRRAGVYLGELRSELTEFGVSYLWGLGQGEDESIVCIAPPDFFEE